MIFVADVLQIPIKRLFNLIYLDIPYRVENYDLFVKGTLRNVYPLLNRNSYLLIWTNMNTRFLTEEACRYYVSKAFRLSNEIIWCYNFGLYTRQKFVNSHDTLLVYKKGSPAFNWTKITIESQRLKYGDRRADLRGRVPGDVWNYSRQPGNSLARRHLKDLFHRSVQPREMLIRIINAYTIYGDWVLDPFMGSGSLCFTCNTYGRNYVGFDINKGYVSEVQERMKAEK